MISAYARNAIVLGLLAAVGPFAIDMYLPALPTIAADLGATTELEDGEGEFAHLTRAEDAAALSVLQDLERVVSARFCAPLRARRFGETCTYDLD